MISLVEIYSATTKKLLINVTTLIAGSILKGLITATIQLEKPTRESLKFNPRFTQLYF